MANEPFNTAIAFENLADLGIITASSQQLLMPTFNLQNGHVQRRWRSLNAPAYCVLDAGALMSIDTVALFGMTMSDNGTAQIRISTVDSSGSAGDAYDSGVVAVDAGYGSSISLLPAPVSGRYVRFDLADAGADYVEAGRLFVGTRTQFRCNHIYGWQRAWVDRSVRAKTRGGQTQIWNDNHYRTMDLTFDFLSETEMNDVVDVIDRENGLHKDVLLIRNPQSDNLARDSVWGLMTELTPAGTPQIFDVFSKQFKVEERL